MTAILFKCGFLLPNRFRSSFIKRFYSKKTVRVRFAPSPTGLLHLGGLRTALYNYLFAKSQNGIMILRIEDTDQCRKVDGASKYLIEDLAWCGIKFDEGPYHQSDRIELYKKYAHQLLEEKKAYYCFCNKSRLELLRKEAMKVGEVPKYDNKCRSLTNKEIEDRLANGEVPCIRFMVSPLDGPIEDLIFSPLVYKIEQVEGDPVILKSDGFPTYHFANVIDDHFMNVTHVLRGAEWQVSTAKHLLLYKALHWNPPLYGHIPLLLNADGSKLSKRQGDIHIRGLRENGYFPNAVLNFVVRFGGGFHIEQKEKDSKIFTMDELKERFDISKLRGYSSKITMVNLDEYNNMEINRWLEEENKLPLMVKRVQEIVTDYTEKSGNVETPTIDYEYVKLILKKLKVRIKKLEDLTSKNFVWLWFWNKSIIIEDLEEISILENLILELPKTEWELEYLKDFTKKFAKQYKLKFPEFMKLLRKILIHKQEGPSVVDILEILGKDIVLYRITHTIEKSKKHRDENIGLNSNKL